MNSGVLIVLTGTCVMCGDEAEIVAYGTASNDHFTWTLSLPDKWVTVTVGEPADRLVCPRCVEEFAKWLLGREAAS